MTMTMMQLHESEEEKKEEGEGAEKKDDSIVYADLDKSAMSEGNDDARTWHVTMLIFDYEEYSPAAVCNNIKEKLCSEVKMKVPATLLDVQSQLLNFPCYGQAKLGNLKATNRCHCELRICIWETGTEIL